MAVTFVLLDRLEVAVATGANSEAPLPARRRAGAVPGLVGSTVLQAGVPTPYAIKQPLNPDTN